jgi:hypothetical protein
VSGLLAQPVGAFLDGNRAPREVPNLVSLALAAMVFTSNTNRTTALAAWLEF